MGIVPDFGGDEDLVSADAALLQAASDAFFILVDPGSIDVAVSGAQRFSDSCFRLFGGSLPNAESDAENPLAIVQFDSSWCGHVDP
jgi:hypothetical protein